MSFVKKIEGELPLLEKLHLGHTPFQIQYFKTTQQRGSKKFEYWQHLIQIKSLAKTVEDLNFDLEEALLEKKELNRWWKKSSRNTLKLKRLEAKVRDLQRSLDDKELECQRHVTLVKTDFSDMLHLTENEILKDEEQYWIQRLSRQLAFNRLAMEKGLSSGDVQAVASLPPETTQKILIEAQNLLNTGKLWSVEQKQLEG